MAAVEAWPLALCASFAEGGYTSLHRQLEQVVARFLGKEDAVIFNMVRSATSLRLHSLIDTNLDYRFSQGFATNFLGIPCEFTLAMSAAALPAPSLTPVPRAALATKGTLIISGTSCSAVQ